MAMCIMLLDARCTAYLDLTKGGDAKLPSPPARTQQGCCSFPARHVQYKTTPYFQTNTVSSRLNDIPLTQQHLPPSPKRLHQSLLDHLLAIIQPYIQSQQQT